MPILIHIIPLSPFNIDKGLNTKIIKFMIQKIILRTGSIMASFFLPLVAKAQFTVPNYSGTFGIGSRNVEEIVISIIQWILGVLALIAVIMILWGGFMWMTAGGNDERIKKAQGLLRNAIIGLVVILAAWGISIYALNVIQNATGG